MERLNKFLAHAGIGSRRHCDELIRTGRVKVDGQRVDDLGVKVDPDQQKITVDDHPVKSERLVYWLVNKPPGYVCTNRDPAGRPRVIDLLPHVTQRVYTVGRLDEASEGLILLTNDGTLAHALMHPRYGVEKTYQVLVAGKPSPDDLKRLLDGVWLSDGKARAQAVRRMKPQGNSTWLRITLAEGRNREIRRMLAKFGHKVMRLKRVAIGPILLDRLPKGKARKLSLTELNSLQRLIARQEKKLEATRKIALGKAVATRRHQESMPIRTVSHIPADLSPNRKQPSRKNSAHPVQANVRKTPSRPLPRKSIPKD
jgi:23S rRNA pseudouridine2605 synthase